MPLAVAASGEANGGEGPYREHGNHNGNHGRHYHPDHPQLNVKVNRNYSQNVNVQGG
jgi:hypothetical protein